MYFFLKDGVHHHLKGGRGVGQPKEHDRWFEQPFVSNKGCFPLVSPSNANVVISPSYVKLGKQGSSAGLVYELGNQRERVRVSNGPLIQTSVVLDGSEFSILFLNEEEGGGVRTFGRANIAFAGVLDDEFL